MKKLKLTFEDAVFGEGAERTAKEVAAAYVGLSALSDDQFRVLTLRYGLFGEVAHTLYDVGVMVRGLSRERVRQIEAKALRTIRKGLRTRREAGMLTSVLPAKAAPEVHVPRAKETAGPGPRLGQPDEIEGCE